MAEPDGQTAREAFGDLQRWLMRSGARGLSRELGGQLRRAQLRLAGRGEQTPGDVWRTATTTPDPGEPPECAWCPVCRAARRMRAGGPGLGAHLAEAGDAVAAAVQEAFARFDSAVRVDQSEGGPERGTAGDVRRG